MMHWSKFLHPVTDPFTPVRVQYVSSQLSVWVLEGNIRALARNTNPLVYFDPHPQPLAKKTQSA